MRAVLLGVLLCAVRWSQAVDVAHCSHRNTTDSSLTLSPYEDGVVGRYAAEWCTRVEPGASSWVLLLWYNDGENSSCKQPPKEDSEIHKFKPGISHSTYKQDIVYEGNCSYVCLNTTVDLIFSSCYLLKSYFVENEHIRRITQKFVDVQNNYTKEIFFNNTARVEVLLSTVNNDSQDVTIVWHTGVPFTSYEDVLLWRKHNLSLDVSKQEWSRLEALSAACRAPAPAEVRCAARLAPGHYHSQLTLHAPWEHGLFRDQGIITYPFSVSAPSVPAVRAGAGAWWWAAVAAAGAACAGAGAALACRRRRARALHKHVLREWLVHRNESSPAAGDVKPAAGAGAAPARRHILLLYAREGAVAARFTAALKHMLEEAGDTQVYDIFSAEVMAQAAAGAAGAWLRGMMLRADVAVLLLQTPALAALYHHQLHHKDNRLTLQEPLLGRRVLYRAPQYGDSLLQYAVRLAADAAHAPHTYHKYYVATLSELPTEMFPALVPYRRYVLPGAGALLARDVGARAAPSAAALAALHAAATEFTRHAADNPDYLMDELMLI